MKKLMIAALAAFALVGCETQESTETKEVTFLIKGYRKVSEGQGEGKVEILNDKYIPFRVDTVLKVGTMVTAVISDLDSAETEMNDKGYLYNSYKLINAETDQVVKN